MAEKELLEFYVLMEVEKYKRKYQWWLLAGAVLMIYCLILTLFSFSSGGYYSLIFIIYIIPPLMIGILLFFQGMRMRKTHREMVFTLEKMKNPDVPVEEFIHY